MKKCFKNWSQSIIKPVNEILVLIVINQQRMRRLARAFSALIHLVWIYVKIQTNILTFSPTGYVQMGVLNVLFNVICTKISKTDLIITFLSSYYSDER